MKIFFANCGYATGVTGKYTEYLLLFWRYFGVTKQSLTPIIDCLKYEKPDLVALLELNYSQYQYLKHFFHKQYPYSCEVDKYGKGLWRKVLPMQNVHLLLSKHPILQESGVLFEHGTKKAILKVRVGGLNIVLVHLALRKIMRSRQILELKSILFRQKSTVCVGDFNTFGGSSEIKRLLTKDNYVSINKKHLDTYPSWYPRKELDYALASSDVHFKKFHILPETFSDHRALMFEINTD